MSTRPYICTICDEPKWAHEHEPLPCKKAKKEHHHAFSPPEVREVDGVLVIVNADGTTLAL
jgi:hypothetical protein